MKLNAVLLASLLVVISMLSVISFAADKNQNISLATKGQPACQVVIARDADKQDIAAANELAKYLGKIIGTAPKVVSEPGSGNLVKLYVGKTAKASSTASSEVSGLGLDGIVLKSVGKDLILAGNGPRGSIYSVLAFLEDVLGCRWYASDAEEVVPSKPNLSIPLLKVTYTPPFEYRLLYTEAAQNPDIRLRFRLNGTDNVAPVADEFGGGFSFGGGHSLIGLFMKPADYFEKHPEWYAWRKSENKRMPTQLCFTNLEARQQTVKEVKEYIAKTNEKYVSVGMADTDAVCQCENCSAIAEREGAYSGALIDFLNYVAEEVGKTYPDVIIPTLAYWASERPPKNIKLHKNIMIIFGVLNRNHKHDISQVPNYSRYLEEWRKLASHVYMWDYDPHFANFIQPHPNHYVLSRSLQYYKKMKVDGVFVQGSWGPAGEFMHMRAWVNAHMMWNPDRDPRALMNEFASAYYGKAAPAIMKYIDLVNTAVNRQADTWLGVYNADTNNWMTLDDINTATRLFDQAEKAVAKNPKQLFRVRRARLAIDVVWLQRYRELAFEAERRKAAFHGPKDLFAAFDRFKKNEFNINCYREWDGLEGYIKILENILLPPAGKTPGECTGLSSHEWVDVRNDLLKATDAQESAQVDDPAASDGKALVIKGSGENLQAAYDLPARFAGKWRVYAVLRAKPKNGEKAGVAVGIYAPYEIFRTTAEFDNSSSGTYKTVDLGEWKLGEAAKIWVQPNGAGSFGETESTWIDRIFLIHVK